MTTLRLTIRVSGQLCEHPQHWPPGKLEFIEGCIDTACKNNGVKEKVFIVWTSAKPDPNAPENTELKLIVLDDTTYHRHYVMPEITGKVFMS